jgi:hypothetical protein
LWLKWRGQERETVWLRVTSGTIAAAEPTVGGTAALARTALAGRGALIAWWCDPTINLTLTEPPPTFGRDWPNGGGVGIDEVAFYAERAVWRAARTAAGSRWVLIEEVKEGFEGAGEAEVVHTPARLHGSSRFTAAETGRGHLVLREWHVGDEILGFTLVKGGQ